MINIMLNALSTTIRSNQERRQVSKIKWEKLKLEEVERYTTLLTRQYYWFKSHYEDVTLGLP